MREDNRSEEEIDQQEYIEDRQDQEEEIQDAYDSPREDKKDNIFKFFKHLLHIPDSSRSANLKKDELGMMHLHVRAYQDIANYNRLEGCNMVADYMQAKSEMISSTSLSRDGFLDNLFVTQIKRTTKVRHGGEFVKKSWWGAGKKPEGSESSGGEA